MVLSAFFFVMNVFQGSLNMKPWRCIFGHKLDFIDNEMIREAVVGACMSIEKQRKSVRVQQDFRYTKWLLIQRDNRVVLSVTNPRS